MTAADATLSNAERWPLAAVLVVDDEPGMRHFLERTLAPRVGHVACAGSTEEAELLVRRHRFDLVVLDIALPGKSGLQWLRELRESGHAGEVVLITAFADLDTAIEALRAGASDFILKPFRVTQILNALRQCLERGRLQRENWALRRALRQRTPPADGQVGRSAAMRALREALQRAAMVDSPVLLTGEAGTGKELAALTLHSLGQRRGPFVPAHCATMAPGSVEAELFGDAARGRDGLLVVAQGGTVFLDEVGELPLPAQARLARALEERQVRPIGGEQRVPVDVRVVAANARALAPAVARGEFSADLYYRLAVIDIALPPLRAHKEDIPDLVGHFIATLAPRLGVDPIDITVDELAYLTQYDWPGNVRELRNLIERSLILGALNVSALYQGLSAGAEAPSRARTALPTDLQTLERLHIQAVLESVDGDKTRAAQLLGISRRTLERRVAEWAQA
ncbi:MAG TPA: sigma-54 dependent transcriptional regulator [Burkholderiaceae bacterium]|nr:sigma-54 dependent transcriptional regulator [Burkholderiaceae bacterium]